MIFQDHHSIRSEVEQKKMRTCANLILIHYNSFRDTVNAAFKDHLKAKITQKPNLVCSAERNFPDF